MEIAFINIGHKSRYRTANRQPTADQKIQHERTLVHSIVLYWVSKVNIPENTYSGVVF